MQFQDILLFFAVTALPTFIIATTIAVVAYLFMHPKHHKRWPEAALVALVANLGLFSHSLALFSQSPQLLITISTSLLSIIGATVLLVKQFRTKTMSKKRSKTDVALIIFFIYFFSYAFNFVIPFIVLGLAPDPMRPTSGNSPLDNISDLGSVLNLLVFTPNTQLVFALALLLAPVKKLLAKPQYLLPHFSIISAIGAIVSTVLFYYQYQASLYFSLESIHLYLHFFGSILMLLLLFFFVRIIQKYVPVMRKAQVLNFASVTLIVLILISKQWFCAYPGDEFNRFCHSFFSYATGEAATNSFNEQP